MIATLLATTHTASDTIAVPPIRWLAILPPIIMIGGAVVLLAVASLVRRPLRVAVSTVATVVISAGNAPALIRLASWVAESEVNPPVICV